MHARTCLETTPDQVTRKQSMKSYSVISGLDETSFSAQVLAIPSAESLAITLDESKQADRGGGGYQRGQSPHHHLIVWCG